MRRVIRTIASWWPSLRLVVPAEIAVAEDDQRQVAPYGSRIMAVLLFGQAFSLVGSGLTAFALGVKVFQETGSVTRMGTLVMFASLPGILLSPVAGAIVDRWDRRWVLIASNVGAALSTLSLTIPLFLGHLELWEVYLAISMVSSFAALQSPAYAVATTLLVPRQHLGRVNGVTQFLAAIILILTPFLGGVLIARIKVHQIVWIDVATYLVAILTLAVVRIPSVAKAPDESSGRSFRQDITFGWSYITQRRGLFVLLLFGAFVNFALTLGQVLTIPVVLSLSTSYMLGVVQALGGVGVVLGSVLLVAWGIRQRQVRTMLRLTLLFGFALACAGLRPALLTIAAGILVGWFCIPLISGCIQVIWQTRTPVGVQGRVFATRLMIGRSTIPLAPLVAGPLADHLFGPLLTPGGALSESVGKIIGVGPGRGAALLLVLTGITTVLIGLAAHRVRELRMLDQEELGTISNVSCAQAVPNRPAA
jgi:DHA3 family macrolide efflux protein-like MFS transporter